MKKIYYSGLNFESDWLGLRSFTLSELLMFFAIVWVALLIVSLGLWSFQKAGLLDRPGPDIIPKRNPVPTAQGIFLTGGFFLTIALFFPDYFFDQHFLWFVLGGVIILAISLLDTFFSVNAKIRLWVQILVSLIVIVAWNIWLPEIELWSMVIKIPYLISLIFSVLWFVAFINAVNWFDGINGLASWVSSVGFLTIPLLIQFVVFVHYPEIEAQNYQFLSMISDLSLVLFIFSFLYTIVEFKPRGVLRDVGTMFYGLALAYLSLVWGAKIGTILVALSLVIFDAVWVFINRIFVMKKNPLKGDYTHLHYRLLALGWTRSEVRFFVWIYSFVMMVLMLLQWDNRPWKIIILLMSFLIFFWVNIYLFWIKKLPYEYLKKNNSKEK